MSFVVDASIAATWAFPGEWNPHTDALLDRIRTERAIVPLLWWFEIRNVLVVGERRRRIEEAQTVGFLRLLSALPIHIDHPPDETSLLALCRRYRLSVYDAAYLELATRRSVPLATLDTDLIAAAEAERVPLLL